MKRALFYLLAAALAATAVSAQDTVVFKNGDVLTGTILKQDRLRVYFRSESFGTISLNAADIAQIRIASPEIGEISVPSEPAAPPKAAAQKKAPPPPKKKAAPPPAKKAAKKAPSKKVVKKAPPKKAKKVPPVVKKKKRWSGQTGLAIAMRSTSRSNRYGVYREERLETYRFYGNLNWKGEKNSLRWNWTYRYSEDDIRIRDDYFNITQKYNRTLKNGYYAEAKTVYQQDYNRDIRNEYLQTAEIGKKWFQRKKVQFSTSVGAGYHQFERHEVTTREPKFILDESLRWQMINSLTLFQKYTHLGDFRQYHFVFTSGLENKLIRDVFLRLEYRLDRDTEINYDDRGYYDKALLTSLLYKF